MNKRINISIENKYHYTSNDKILKIKLNFNKIKGEINIDICSNRSKWFNYVLRNILITGKDDKGYNYNKWVEQRALYFYKFRLSKFKNTGIITLDYTPFKSILEV